MRSIAEALLGREAGRLLEILAGRSEEDDMMADRVAEAGQWCETTPDQVPRSVFGGPPRSLPTPGEPGRSHRPFGI